jgi:hypothetical protein
MSSGASGSRLLSLPVGYLERIALAYNLKRRFRVQEGGPPPQRRQLEQRTWEPASMPEKTPKKLHLLWNRLNLVDFAFYANMNPQPCHSEHLQLIARIDKRCPGEVLGSECNDGVLELLLWGFSVSPSYGFGARHVREAVYLPFHGSTPQRFYLKSCPPPEVERIFVSEPYS